MKCYACGKLVSCLLVEGEGDIDQIRVTFHVTARLQTADLLIKLGRSATNVDKPVISLVNVRQSMPTANLLLKHRSTPRTSLQHLRQPLLNSTLEYQRRT